MGAFLFLAEPNTIFMTYLATLCRICDDIHTQVHKFMTWYSYGPVMVTESILCTTFGVPDAVPSAAIVFTTFIPDVTCPKIE